MNKLPKNLTLAKKFSIEEAVLIALNYPSSCQSIKEIVEYYQPKTYNFKSDNECEKCGGELVAKAKRNRQIDKARNKYTRVHNDIMSTVGYTRGLVDRIEFQSFGIHQFKIDEADYLTRQGLLMWLEELGKGELAKSIKKEWAEFNINTPDNITEYSQFVAQSNSLKSLLDKIESVYINYVSFIASKNYRQKSDIESYLKAFKNPDEPNKKLFTDRQAKMAQIILSEIHESKINL